MYAGTGWHTHTHTDVKISFTNKLYEALAYRWFYFIMSRNIFIRGVSFFFIAHVPMAPMVVLFVLKRQQIERWSR